MIKQAKGIISQGPSITNVWILQSVARGSSHVYSQVQQALLQADAALAGALIAGDCKYHTAGHSGI
jgi:hypothetical protein